MQSCFLIKSDLFHCRQNYNVSCTAQTYICTVNNEIIIIIIFLYLSMEFSFYIKATCKFRLGFPMNKAASAELSACATTKHCENAESTEVRE